MRHFTLLRAGFTVLYDIFLTIGIILGQAQQSPE